MNSEKATNSLQKERNYGVDLLRAVSMYMILLLHLVNHGGAIDNTAFLSGQWFVSWILSVVCYCAVNCFAAISGYVGVDADYKWKRLISLWFTVAFYSIGITIVFYFMQPESVSSKQWISAFAPIVTNQYWYMTSYFGLFLLIPVLNGALNNLPREVLLGVLAVVILFICLIPNLTHCTQSSLGLHNGYSALWLIIMYLVGGIVKKMGIGNKTKTSFLMVLFVISCLAVFLSKTVVEVISLKTTGEIRGGSTFLDYTSPFILLNAILLLCLFSRIKPRSNRAAKLITVISSTALGVYLIHVNPLVWDNVLYKSTESIADMHPAIMVPVFLLLSAGIYLACHILDRIRQLLFRLLSISKLCDGIERVWLRILSKCCSLIK